MNAAWFSHSLLGLELKLHMQNMRRLALELDAVSYKYPRARVWALRDIHLRVPQGSFVIISGPTGSGKSTVLKVARGLHSEIGGELVGRVWICGVDVTERRASTLGKELSLLFQDPATQLHQLRLLDELMSGPMYQGLPWQECLKRATEAVAAILGGLSLESSPNEISSGE